MVQKKTARETLESMKPDPEKEAPRRSWLYIFLAIIIIFGLTFIFQQLNDPPAETIDPYSFDQLKDQVMDLNREVEDLKRQNEALEERISDLEQ